VEDTAVGRQAGTSSRLENYLGFPTGISGADLIWRGEIQTMKFGKKFEMPCRVVKLAVQSDGHFLANLNTDQQIFAKSVVVATDVKYRRLSLDWLKHFEGRGVYYAATEMKARYCQNSRAVVVGGGNSTGQASEITDKDVHIARSIPIKLVKMLELACDFSLTGTSLTVLQNRSLTTKSNVFSPFPSRSIRSPSPKKRISQKSLSFAL
jgi:alkyl hydroperoxide reductase subunit AhpF